MYEDEEVSIDDIEAEMTAFEEMQEEFGQTFDEEND